MLIYNNMENQGDYSFLTPDEKKKLIVATVNHVDSLWLEWLKPLIPFPLTNQITGERIEIEPYDYELPIEWYHDDGENSDSVDTLSVMTAVLTMLEEIFNGKKLRKNELVGIARQTVDAINNLMKKDPREPDTERLKEKLLDEYIKNDDEQAYIVEQSIPLKITAYSQSDEKSKGFIFQEINSTVRDSNALEIRNQLITSLWDLPIEDFYDTSGLQEEDDWLDRDDIDGEVKFYGPNKSWKEEREGEIEQEKYPLPLSESERYFLGIVPHDLARNTYLIPHMHAWVPFDTNAHGAILSKMLLRKSLIAIYAENNPRKNKGSKKLQTQYGDHLEALLQEIESVKYRLQVGE